MTLALILALLSVWCAAAAILNESGNRVGGITFFRLWRWRVTVSKAKRSR